MLIYSMSVSVDGFIADRAGGFGWTVPNEGQFRFHIAQTRELGGYLCGRRLYETMLVWERDPSMRDNELGAAFADVWCAIPKVVFSRTLDSVQGNARLAEASLAEEAAVALDSIERDASIGGAGLAAAAIELGLVDELRLFRNPVVVGGGTPFLSPVTEDVRLGELDAVTRVAIESARGVIDSDAATAAWERALEAPAWNGTPAWIHTDLLRPNLLVHGGRLAAIIDFGGVGVGDPAADLIAAWSVFGHTGRGMFRGALDVDDGAWNRARGFALHQAATIIPYYAETNPGFVALAKRTVEEVLADINA